jgi:hypothetical protein
MLPRRTNHALIEAVKTAVDRVVGQTWDLEVEKTVKGLTAHRGQLPDSQQFYRKRNGNAATMMIINLAESN